jgi:hypothetical protein
LGEKDRTEATRKKREPLAMEELDREEKERIERVVEHLRDGEMKEILSRLFSRGLALQKGRGSKG